MSCLNPRVLASDPRHVLRAPATGRDRLTAGDGDPAGVELETLLRELTERLAKRLDVNCGPDGLCCARIKRIERSSIAVQNGLYRVRLSHFGRWPR
jgi:hypothetical protein